MGNKACYPIPHSTLFPARQLSVGLTTIRSNEKQVFDAVEAAYRLHGSGNTLNPDSYFLRYPDRPSARIIALPADVGGAVQKNGIKWISSFQENRASNLARASAVLILKDATTGYPLACIEASLISATAHCRVGSIAYFPQSKGSTTRKSYDKNWPKKTPPFPRLRKHISKRKFKRPS
jgi:N-[(2S)-2-amino-2-carboxyethyl]-L-glutamate dehydrogenase